MRLAPPHHGKSCPYLTPLRHNPPRPQSIIYVFTGRMLILPRRLVTIDSRSRRKTLPGFLVAQTVLVAIWIGINVAGVAKFDIYPFILHNLAFSLQAAYAAPLILLAQTRQAERDKAHAEADALHREALAAANEQRLAIAAQNAAQMLKLLAACRT